MPGSLTASGSDREEIAARPGPPTDDRRQVADLSRRCRSTWRRSNISIIRRRGAPAGVRPFGRPAAGAGEGELETTATALDRPGLPDRRRYPDVTATSQALGKTAGKDVMGKATYRAVRHRRFRRKAQELVEAALRRSAASASAHRPCARSPAISPAIGLTAREAPHRSAAGGARLAESRHRAQALVLAGQVLVDERKVEKPTAGGCRRRGASSACSSQPRGRQVEGALRHGIAVVVSRPTWALRPVNDCLLQNGA